MQAAPRTTRATFWGMPTQARQAPAQTQAPQATSTAGPAPRQRRQDTVGNGAIAASLPDGPVQDQLPSQLSLEEAGLSFQLPGDTLLTGDWNQLTTTSATGVWLNVKQDALTVSFSPPLLLDAQWPLSNVEWSGFTYSFKQGRLTWVGLQNTQIAIPIAGSVRDHIAKFVDRLVRGTSLGRPGYDPMADPDVSTTLRKVQANLAAQQGGGKPSDLKARDVTDVAMSATVRTKEDITAGSGKGSLAIPKGATLSVNVGVSGNGATLPKGGVPDVRYVDLSSSDLVISKDGEPVARIRSLRVERGGAVDVHDFEPLGKLATMGGAESLVRLLGVFAALQGGDPRLAGGGDIAPRGTMAFGEKELEKSLTSAVRDLVDKHHDAVPGVDLRGVLGMKTEKPAARS